MNERWVEEVIVMRKEEIGEYQKILSQRDMLNKNYTHDRSMLFHASVKKIPAKINLCLSTVVS